MPPAPIKHGFHVNQPTNGSPSILRRALKNLKTSRGTIRAVRDLIPMIYDINGVGQHNWSRRDTALMYWVDKLEPGERLSEDTCLEITKLLLDHGASLTARDQEGNTPLHIAAASCWPSVVKLLADRGADVNARDYEGGVPLHMATWHNSSTPGIQELNGFEAQRSAMEKVEILLGAGANPEAKSYSGSRALSPLYEGWRHHDLFEKMVALYIASAKKRDDPVNVVDFLHRYPLLLSDVAFEMRTAKDGHELLKDHFEFLLGFGLDISEFYDTGTSPLTVSLKLRGDEPVTEETRWLFLYLLSKGANINATNYQGKTILDVTDDLPTKRLLIRHGALLSSQLDKAVDRTVDKTVDETVDETVESWNLSRALLGVKQKLRKTKVVS
ncbi:unnamed protein product [Clonostachys rosea]|uniref:Uncharacterized protein n=1 Tax=Bionectria ochroleuca TaxID=29856 RepID=A0ABY6UAH9_BIOOC|nr:unnamed protein product [Clonostachys rosea]